MLIGVDLDGVLVDFMSSFLNYYNHVYGTNLTRDQIYTYDLWKIFGETREKAIQKISDFYKTHHFNSLEPIQDSIEAIDTLKQNHDLVVITSRHNDIIEGTKRWLEKYFPNKFSEVYLTNQYSLDEDYRRKSDICLDLGINVLIEDSLDYAKECIPKTRVLLFDQPWNQSQKLPESITRVKSWKEILDNI